MQQIIKSITYLTQYFSNIYLNVFNFANINKKSIWTFSHFIMCHTGENISQSKEQIG